MSFAGWQDLVSEGLVGLGWCLQGWGSRGRVSWLGLDCGSCCEDLAGAVNGHHPSWSLMFARCLKGQPGVWPGPRCGIDRPGLATSGPPGQSALHLRCRAVVPNVHHRQRLSCAALCLVLVGARPVKACGGYNEVFRQAALGVSAHSSEHNKLTDLLAGACRCRCYLQVPVPLQALEDDTVVSRSTTYESGVVVVLA